MQFGYVIRNCEQIGHLPKRLTGIVHVETGYDYPNAPQCKLLAYVGDLRVTKLCLINTHHISVLRSSYNSLCTIYGCALDKIGVVTNNF